jgi:cytochrome P450
MPSPLPPGPKGTPLGGSLRAFAGRRLDFFVDVARTYGDLASFRFGPRRIFLASHPDLVEQVLVTDARHYIKHFGARMYKPVLGNGLVTSEGDFWLRQRRLAQPAFSKQRVLSYVPVMAAAVDRMLDTWVAGKEVDVHFEFSSLTSAIALKTLFDLDDAGDRKRFTDTLHLAFDLMSDRFRKLVRMPLWVPTPANVRLRRSVRELFAVVDGFIAAGRARPQPGNDLLSRLINARDEDGPQMTPTQLRDEAMTLYLAGHETTALTLTWSWYLLARHPGSRTSWPPSGRRSSAGGRRRPTTCRGCRTRTQ